MTPKDYIEAVALELQKLRGNGLVLSPADASLALSWHAAGVPLQAVLGEIRRGARLKSRAQGVRGVTEIGLSLHAIAPSVASKARTKVQAPKEPDDGIAAELLRACNASELPARERWQQLARRAEQLLAQGGEAYWTEAIAALRIALRELPPASRRKLGVALRARMAPKPSAMPMQRYRRSLQLQMLSAASHELGVPPRQFLL